MQPLSRGEHHLVIELLHVLIKQKENWLNQSTEHECKIHECVYEDHRFKAISEAKGQPQNAEANADQKPDKLSFPF